MSYRTPVKQALGLGSAKYGVQHWWVQRVTAVALVPLVVWFAFGVAVHAGADYETVRAWIGSPITAVLFIALIAITCHHMQLGLQVVIEDYVHARGPQIATIVLVKFVSAILALAGIFAVLRIALGG
ncbi:MAG: succinate dehydrogenase, hydrophobic membrane anchor protein [Aquisalimonadaceae bacterium]